MRKLERLCWPAAPTFWGLWNLYDYENSQSNLQLTPDDVWICEQMQISCCMELYLHVSLLHFHFNMHKMEDFRLILWQRLCAPLISLTNSEGDFSVAQTLKSNLSFFVVITLQDSLRGTQKKFQSFWSPELTFFMLRQGLTLNERRECFDTWTKKIM